jgi:uncharacterized membrane protein YjgN (DUF898 family)
MSEFMPRTMGDSGDTAGDGGSRELPFEFRGDGAEYFKIWIVNILLTIVTLGVYSAWAKVRNKRYFYSNLYLDGESFRYLADPITILKSRVIAVVVFVAFVVLSETFPVAGGVLALALMGITPLLVVRSLNFNHRVSAYRNIQFRFGASYGEAAMALLVWPILGVLTLGLLYPYAVRKSSEFLVRNSRYGTADFDFEATTWDYGRIFLIFFGVLIATLITPLALTAGFTMLVGDWAFGLSSIVALAGYLFAGAYLTVMLTNVYYNSASLQAHELAANLEVLGYTKVFVVNAILTVVTLGLFLPFAKVRMAKYRADHTQFIAAGSLEEFAAAEREQVSALGEELGEVFDFDVGAI